MDQIFMEGMQFYGYHGVYSEESRLGQRFVVSLVLSCDLRDAVRTDDLSLTVNYGEVYNVVKEIVEGPPRRLVEAVAGDIAASVLARFGMVERVRVRLEKPGAPIAGIFSAAGVEIERP